MGMDRRRRVEARQHARARHGRDEGAVVGEICPEIGDGMDLEAEEGTVLGQRQPGLGHVVAALRVGEERFRPLGGPLDRPADLPRRPRHQNVLAIEEELHAEAAADIGRHHPELLGLHLEHALGDQALDRVRALRRGVEDVAVFLDVEVAERAPRLHRIDDDAVVDEVELDHLVGLGEGGIGRLGIAQLPVEDLVALGLRPDLGRVEGARAQRVGGGRQRAPVDVDQLGGIARLGEGLGDDQRDGVADMAGRVLDQDRIGGHRRLRSVAILQRDLAGDAAEAVGLDVGAGQDREHARSRLRRRRVLDLEGRVRMRRPHDEGRCLTRQVDIVGIAPTAGDEPHVFLATNGLAESELTHRTLL